MIFHCKEFSVEQSDNVFKITTDATLLGALSLKDVNPDKDLSILEVGAGTGIISLMIAQRFPNSTILAIDNNKYASELCANNFLSSKFADRLQYKEENIMKFESDILFDSIVLNPPYFLNATRSTSDVNRISRHLSEFTYGDLIKKLEKVLSDKGTIYMIHPARYLNLIQKACEENKLGLTERINIRHSKEKPIQNMISGIKKLNDRSVSESTFNEIYFNLKNSDQSFSLEYIDSLKDFLTIF